MNGSGSVEYHQLNTYAAMNVEYHCPKADCSFFGSSNTCPHCHTSLGNLSHWKWFSDDEPHPHDLITGDGDHTGGDR